MKEIKKNIMIRQKTEMATNNELFAWYAQQVENEKGTESGKKFLQILKDDPEALEKFIQDSLHEVIMFACVDLNKAFTGDTTIAKPLVNYLKAHFSI